MFQQLTSRTTNRFLMWSLLLIGLTFMPAWTEGALARVRVCRADPIVVLSDNRVVRMTVEVAAGAEDVDVIVYTLRVPRGVTAKQITYTGGELGKKERVNIVADQAGPALYSTTTIVQTSAASQAVRQSPAAVKVTSQVGDRPQSFAGKSDQPITLNFNLSK